jgi:HD-GYP domain-containing protein (c-di-GMP phosphodiesterase class II)
MGLVLVSQLKKGCVLEKDVHTSLGGLLMEKGISIYDKEIEVLQAFLIKEVMIEDNSTDQQAVSATNENMTTTTVEQKIKKVSSTTFEQLFYEAVVFYKKMFESVRGGFGVPMLELRAKVTPLLQQKIDPEQILITLKQDYSIDDYLYFHSVSVGVISTAIARWSKLGGRECISVGLAGVLHDIGKAKIDAQLLHKSGRLTPDELNELRRYTYYGYQVMKSLPTVTEPILMGILQHQERADGSGYPLKLKEDSIHPYARIIAISDIFHAMSSKRTYQEAASPYLVLEQLLSDSFGKLDPGIVRIFIEGMTHFSNGTLIELSDGSIGRIVFTDRNEPTRPMVDINTEIINLAMNRKLSIRRIIVE